MAQKTAWTGAALTQTDINTYLMHEGGAWSTWTPAVTQSGAVTATNTRSTYFRAGRLIIAQFRLDITGTGTTANAISLSLPATAASSGYTIGSGFIQDTSAGASGIFEAAWTLSSTTVMIALRDGTSTGIGSSPAFAITNTDVIHGFIVYEAAS